MGDVIVDEEWVELMIQARELKLTKEEVLHFLEIKAIENKKDEPNQPIIF